MQAMQVMRVMPCVCVFPHTWHAWLIEACMTKLDDMKQALVAHLALREELFTIGEVLASENDLLVFHRNAY